jgi:RNA polymerase sigma-70 factor (ECF subfamily)
MAPEDIQLAEDLLSGTPGAFERFVDVYHSKLFQYSYLMCGQPEDAEEVSQETLLNVFENLRQLQRPERLKAWVFRIAKNACLMKRRRSVFAPARELSLDEPLRSRDGSSVAPAEIPDRAVLPDAAILRSELRKRIDAGIAELPELYRSVLLLRDVEGLSTEEAAEVLGVSEAVVKQRLHRARVALRSGLETYLKTAAAVSEL